MNKIYRLVWSKIYEKWIVASEKVSCGCRPSSVVGALTFAAFLALAGTAFSLDPNALPTGGKITAGSGNISTSSNTMTVNQSTQQMIANWDTFNIGQKAGVKFNQPNSTATALNRIYDQNPSQILGSLSANGKIFLINPSGIIFGANARVDVGGLVASSLNMLDSDYLAGKFKFTNSGTAGSILNQGSITANGGVAALIAPKVTNEGTITAKSGSVILAAANEVSLDFKGDGLITYTISQGAVDALAANKGLIKADGGLVVMTAKAADSINRAVVNNSGIIEAQTLQNKGGRILLLSDMENGTTNVSGTLDASAPNGGDGGFVETSGGRVKIGDGTKVTTSAPQGKTGLWLIDPADFTIATDKTGTVTGGTPSGDISGSTLSSALGLSGVTILSSQGSTLAGSGDINVNDAVSWSANLLTLTAARDININAVMKASNTASLTMNTATANGGDAAVSGGTVKVGFNTDKTFKGRVDFFKADGSTPRSGTGFLTINGAGYTVITDLGAHDSITGTDLQGMVAGDATVRYALGSNIDASTTSGWNSGEGFTPIGTLALSFTGKFDGLGHTVNNLTIARSGTGYQGLFGWTESATVRNVGLINADITGGNYVGGLIGYNSAGSITNAYATGNVKGNNYVGGLVGQNLSSGTSATASITNSYATGAVQGNDYVGGLVGWNYAYVVDHDQKPTASITNSYATGTVTGNGNYVGGLVGQNYANVDGILENASATASIINSYATGDVTGIDKVGGLVGLNAASGGYTASITDTYATGAVTATGSNKGGLVGLNSGGIITNSFWNKETTGKTRSSGSPDADGKTTTEMYALATFKDAGWSIVSNPNLAAGYPVFAASGSIWVMKGQSDTLTTTTATATTTATTTITNPDAPSEERPLPPAQDPSYTPPPPVIDPGDPNSGIVIIVVSQPSPGTAGVIIVTIPGTLAEPGVGFSFPLPQQLVNVATAATVKVTLPDGSPLPSWLQYKSDTVTLAASNVPEEFLSIEILITVGNQSWTVKITK